MTDDFTTQLRDRLHRAADGVALPAAGPEAAVARARARHRNRRAVVAGLGATALLAAAATTLGDTGDDRASLATQTELPVGAPVALDWREADDGISNVRSSTVDSGSGATYALSTAPGLRSAGEAPPADTVYRLGDDGRWTPVAVGDDGGRPARLAADGGVLYAIGTAVGDAGALETVVGASTDGGQTWSEHVLTEAAPPNDTLPWQRIDRLGIAAAGGRRVALTTTAYDVDWNSFVGDDGTDSWVRGIVGDDGVRLVRETQDGGDVTEEDLGLRTWDELDLPGPEVFEARTAVHVDEGDGWVETPTELAGQHLLSLRAVGGRFVLRTYESLPGDSGEVLHRTLTSDDGRTWQEVVAPGAYDVAPLGDGFVGLSQDTGTLVRSADDGQWADVDLGSVDERLAGGSVGLFSVGDLGVAFTLHGDDGRPSYLVFTPDLRSWTVEPLADLFGATDMWPDLVEVGADRIVVVGTDGGAGEGPARTATLVGVPRR